MSPERDAEVARVRRSKSSPESSSIEHRVDQLIGATRPLLELFAVVNDVFTEDDAMKQGKQQVGMGRIYRQWKKTRTALGGDDV